MPTPREKTLFALVLLFGTFFIGGFLYAWTNPSQAPPGGNVAAPLNAGSGAQSKRVQYGGFTAPFIEAIKELNAKSEAQQAEIVELRAEIDKLKSRLGN